MDLAINWMRYKRFSNMTKNMCVVDPFSSLIQEENENKLKHLLFDVHKKRNDAMLTCLVYWEVNQFVLDLDIMYTLTYVD